VIAKRAAAAGRLPDSEINLPSASMPAISDLHGLWNLLELVSDTDAFAKLNRR
jgi:hypothetical protein